MMESQVQIGQGVNLEFVLEYWAMKVKVNCVGEKKRMMHDEES